MKSDNYWVQRMATRRGVLRGTALGGIGLATAAAVGCGDDSTSTKTATSAATGAATSGATAAATAAGSAAASVTPKKGGTLTFAGVGSSPPTFDPLVTEGFATRIPVGFAYSKLLGHKSGPGVNFQAPPIEPDLAASYEVSDGGQTIIFKLRQGVKFQPPVNREMKAADVVFSYGRYTGTAPGSKATAGNVGRFTQNIDSFTATDDYTIVVKAKRPYFPLIDAFASPSYLFVLPTEAGTAFDPATKMVGTGPFVTDSYRPGDGITYSAFRDWFRIKDRPIYVDKVDYLWLNADVFLTQFLAKKLDVGGPIPGASLARVKQEIPDVQLWGAAIGCTSLAFSSRDPHFKDPRVRQALSMAMDRDGIDDSLFGVKSAKSAGINIDVGWMNFVSPRNKDEYLDPKGKEIKPETAKLFKQDLTAAKQLLSAAGFGSGFESKIVRPNIYPAPWSVEPEILAQMFSQIGVKTTVEVQDYGSQYVPKTRAGDFDTGMVLLSDGQSDAADYIELWFQSTSPRNTGKINDPQVDKMLADIQGSFNAQERAKKLKDMQQYLDDNMYNVPIESSGGPSWTGALSTVQNIKDYQIPPAPWQYGTPSSTIPFWWKNA